MASEAPPPEQEDTPLPRPRPPALPENRALWLAISNYALEIREHLRGIRLLADDLRALRIPAPKGWPRRLAAELEEHARSTRAAARAVRGKPPPGDPPP